MLHGRWPWLGLLLCAAAHAEEDIVGETTPTPEDPSPLVSPPEDPQSPATAEPTPPPGLTPELDAAPAPAPSTVSPPPSAEVLPPPPASAIGVVRDAEGYRLMVNGAPMLIQGMNWGYMPIGQNYSYDFWGQPDDFIEEALRQEMGLLSAMGVNAIRQYAGIPPRWVEWIYDNYGIWTMINPLVGRYGIMVNGSFIPVVDYSDPATREAIRAETMGHVEHYKNTRGMLMWLLGNENNYGLFWSSFEIEALPEDEQGEARARFLYSLYGELIDEIHATDTEHPVAIANGDLQFIDLIAELSGNLDILGTNVYRGISARDLYEEVEEKLGVPVMYSEFGADAYDAKNHREDHLTQARYVLGQWREIYEQSHGKGRVGNAIGGFTFQWSDGWWKYQQETNLDIHDTTASWPNGGYPEDYVDGQNNMNEEWFGICAKGPPDARGLYTVYPRAAYYVLQAAYRLDPYGTGVDLQAIDEHFSQIDPLMYDRPYQSSQAVAAVERLQRASIRDLRLDMWTTFSGGTDEDATPGGQLDHTESITVDVGVNPTDQLDASAAINVLGNVSANRIDTIFYENRGRSTVSEDDTAELTPEAMDPVRLYNARFRWTNPNFIMEGYYRVGHNHWGYDGDFFGLYREAFYGEWIDTYNGNAPLGVEVHGRGNLQGLSMAFGPQIYWGANPSAVGRYQFSLTDRIQATVMHQEEFRRNMAVDSTTAIPEQPLRRSTVSMEWRAGGVGVQLGGIAAGSNKIGQTFTSVQPAATDQSYNDSGYDVLHGEIDAVDTLGGKLKVTVESGGFHWYGQAAYKGLVADGGPDYTITYTGWRLKEDGRGNHYSALSGLAYNLGNWQLAPNFLYQKPLQGPLPPIEDTYDPLTGEYWGRIAPRNVIDDPFAVLGNRETVAGEFLLSYDPTPATWMWMWDNDVREDAPFAASLGVVYRHQPTSRDATFGFTEDGTMFTFASAPPAQDVWEVNGRAVSNLGPDATLVLHAYGGTGQANGDSTRLVTRYGGDFRLWWKTVQWSGMMKIDDWGPYDYHRDYNLTFPLQLATDMSFGLVRPRLYRPYTRAGIRGKLRYLDDYSPGFVPTNINGFGWGEEYEVETYVQITL